MTAVIALGTHGGGKNGFISMWLWMIELCDGCGDQTPPTVRVLIVVAL